MYYILYMYYFVVVHDVLFCIQDAVEFVGVVAHFLGNLNLVIQSCYDMFINRPNLR